MEIQLYKTHVYGPDKNNGARFHIIPEIKGLWVEWFGYPSEEEYKTIILDGLSLVKSNSLEYWIADTRNLELISESANLWTVTEAVPIGVQNGLVRLSFLIPQEYLAQFSVESLAENLMDQLKKLNIDAVKIKYFDNLEAAMQWRE
jgi:hypothetical protein